MIRAAGERLAANSCIFLIARNFAFNGEHRWASLETWAGAGKVQAWQARVFSPAGVRELYTTVMSCEDGCAPWRLQAPGTGGLQPTSAVRPLGVSSPATFVSEITDIQKRYQLYLSLL